MGISDLDKYITDPHNEEEVKTALDRVCYELSNPVKDECVRLVNSYLNELIEMIVSEYTPEEICLAIRMCGPKDETISKKKVLNNRTMDMAERAVEMVCSYMPEAVSDRCVDFVQEYGDEVIRLIVDMEMNPKLVCAALTLCDAVDEVEEDEMQDYADLFDARAFGGRMCAWGPSYWCKSRFHARQCGTTRHCEEHGWQDEE